MYMAPLFLKFSPNIDRAALLMALKVNRVAYQAAVEDIQSVHDGVDPAQINSITLQIGSCAVVDWHLARRVDMAVPGINFTLLENHDSTLTAEWMKYNPYQGKWVDEPQHRLYPIAGLMEYMQDNLWADPLMVERRLRFQQFKLASIEKTIEVMEKVDEIVQMGNNDECA